MRNYVAFWRGHRIDVQADTSYEAQQIAHANFCLLVNKLAKRLDVTVVLADRPINTASL